MINSMSDKSESDSTTKYIIIALIVIAIVLAGAFVYIYGFGSNDSPQPQQVENDDSDTVESDEPAQAQSTGQSAQATPQTTAMSILGGSFETGGGLEDKTYASIYVGPEHSGENVKIQIYYSRDGNTLNNGNMVPKTVDSSGYINVRSADSYKYFPDLAEINLYDDSGNLLDTQTVSLNPESGTQTF